MNKTKWLKIEVECTHKKLVDLVRLAQFSERIGYGFNLLFRDERNVGLRFIEKIASVEVITDPYGVSTSVETTRYLSIRFQLYVFSAGDATRYFMEVNSPPRSLRTLVAALANTVPGVMVSEVDIPVLDAFAVLRKSSITARLTRIKASQLKLTEDSVATIEVVSVKNAAADLKRFFPSNDVTVDKIRVDRPFGTSAHAIELTRSGLISADVEYAETASQFVLDLLTKHYHGTSKEEW
ncbi:hypothetical protein [Burkholderia gladioli]|uniref:hypothetical protein n=1 Tax=Burkholderia gladioli TaxID=28095 RepID=UPI00163DEDB8|nr:hypothetical protein [Burkholderia gladioli]